MRPLRYSINVTLDGCCDHRAVVPDESLHRHHTENLARADALLFGRVTYQMMEEAWRDPPPGSRPAWTEPFAQTIGPAKKYVVSRTLQRVDWNAELLRGDLREAAQRLKEQPGKGIFVGGVTLPAALAEMGLIDEYEFVVHPRVAGHGPTLFAGCPSRSTSPWWTAWSSTPARWSCATSPRRNRQPSCCARPTTNPSGARTKHSRVVSSYWAISPTSSAPWRSCSRPTRSSTSSTANMMRRRPSAFDGASRGSVLTAAGRWNLDSSTRPCPSGVRSMVMSVRTPLSPTVWSTHGPSIVVSPSTSMPISRKKAFAASRSSTTMRTLSIRCSPIPAA